MNEGAINMITEPAGSVAPGSEGLLFLPYLTGERTPYANPDARAVFFGLTLRHTKAHLTRAVLEGVCFGLRDSTELMRGLGIDLSDVRISGGGAESALWRQILADVLGVELKGSAAREGAAYGAALLAATGAGAFSSVQEASGSQVQTTGKTTPSPAAADYEKAYEHFRALYPALEPHFKSA
jgi:xylulokinase